MIQVIYLGHSGFLVELETAYLLFDYYTGTLPVLDLQKHLYVFSSHAHFDHFKKKIFAIRSEETNVSFVLSDDIKASSVPKRCNPIFVGQNQRIVVKDCEIRTLRSTDVGVAFLVKCGETTLYHAGDLNWWHWKGESEAFNKLMSRNYQYEISKIDGETIDVAFIPVDSRLEEQYIWGLHFFMQHTHTKAVFPMHFWEDYKIFDKLEQEKGTDKYRDRVYRIEREGQQFQLEEK